MSLNRKDISTARKGVDLQHRHFAFIAATLKSLQPDSDTLIERRAEWRLIVDRFADECRETNPRFDYQRFLSACGVSA